MNKYLRACVLAALMLPVFVVLSIVATMLLFPFWSWLESFSGIESVGHSGPADWCYLFVFVLLLVVLAAASILRDLRRAGQQNRTG